MLEREEHHRVQGGPAGGAGRRAGPKLVLAALSLALAAGGAEALLRLTEKPAPSMLFAPFAAHMTKNHLDDFLGVVQDDPDLFWVLAPNRRLPDDAWPIRGLISNAAGLREDHEIAPEKPAGEVRILFLGDSCTFGFGSLANESFVEQAERALNARYPQVKTECLNAGVPGYSLYQGWRFLEMRGWNYAPDLVVATFGWNDERSWADQSDLQHGRRKQAATPPPGLRRSLLARRLWEAGARLGAGKSAGGKSVRVPPEEFAEILGYLQRSAADRGVETRVLAWPMRRDLLGAAPTPYREVLRDFGAAHGGICIEPLPAFRRALEQHGVDELYIDQGHVRPLGNQLVAEAVVEALRPWFEARLGISGKEATP